MTVRQAGLPPFSPSRQSAKDAGRYLAVFPQRAQIQTRAVVPSLRIDSVRRPRWDNATTNATEESPVISRNLSPGVASQTFGPVACQPSRLCEYGQPVSEFAHPLSARVDASHAGQADRYDKIKTKATFHAWLEAIHAHFMLCGPETA